jgi:chromosome partitioning protein
MKISKLASKKGLSNKMSGTCVMEAGEQYGVRQVEDGVIFTACCPMAGSVQVAGDFNNWQPQRAPMRKIDENGVWRVKLPLSAGSYRYRLVVDGQWQQDPYNKATEPNPYGELNSVVHVS